MSQQVNTQQTLFEQLMEKDRWHASELGLSLSADTSDYWLKFSQIKPCWLRAGSKQFIYQLSLTKTYNTCCGYLKALSSFSLFVTRINSTITPVEINRRLLVDYIHELCAVKKLAAATVSLYLSGIKCFFEMNLREKWLSLPKEPLIFEGDFPRDARALPKFIPERVIQQLLRHLPTLPEVYQHLLVLFLETGRRRGEIFTLAYYCLEQDGAGDYFMKVEDRKMGKSRLIPISQNCMQHIKQQQASVDKLTSSRDFLFIRKWKGIMQPIKSQSVYQKLNKLAKEKNIVDDNGCLWHFHFHQFRHYVELITCFQVTYCKK